MWPVIIGAGVAAAGYGLWQIGKVSSGRRIPASRNASALLIVDMQQGFLDAFGPEGQTVLDRVLARAAAVKAEGRPVIAIQQIWSTPMGVVLGTASGGAGLPGRDGTALHPEIARAADHILVKRIQDSFETGELDDLLSELDVGALEICGLDGLFCIRATVLAARNRGYRVLVDPQMVLSRNRAKFEKMLAGWNLPARGGKQ